jgi:hypothetical protein
LTLPLSKNSFPVPYVHHSILHLGPLIMEPRICANSCGGSCCWLDMRRRGLRSPATPRVQPLGTYYSRPSFEKFHAPFRL